MSAMMLSMQPHEMPRNLDMQTNMNSRPPETSSNMLSIPEMENLTVIIVEVSDKTLFNNHTALSKSLKSQNLRK